MTTIVSPSSPSNPDDDLIPTATLAVVPSTGAASGSASSRRLPPPCWSAEETVALIDAYKDKWYSLRRGNLRANHWQEVADDVASRCPAIPAKTAVQCRHKMEKLRKRYRADVQRAAAHGGVRRFTSSWVHFQKMHAMERGPNPNPTPPSSSDEEDEHQNSVKRVRDLYSQNHKAVSVAQVPDNNNNGGSSGFRIKIPGGMNPAPRVPKFDLPNPRFVHSVPGVNGGGSSKAMNDSFGGFREISKRSSEIYKVSPGFDEVIAAIHSLGEGFARSEMAKMEMLKQIDQMRLDSERKRTEMIMECQQMILEALSDSSSKRARRSCTPPGGGLK